MAKKAEGLTLREALKRAKQGDTDKEVIQPLIQSAAGVLRYRDDQLKKARNERSAKPKKAKKAKASKKNSAAKPNAEMSEAATAGFRIRKK